MSTAGRDLHRSGSLLAAATYIGLGATFLANLVVTAQLTQSARGVFAAWMAVSAIGSTFTGFGAAAYTRSVYQSGAPLLQSLRLLAGTLGRTGPLVGVAAALLTVWAGWPTSITVMLVASTLLGSGVGVALATRQRESQVRQIIVARLAAAGGYWIAVAGLRVFGLLGLSTAIAALLVSQMLEFVLLAVRGGNTGVTADEAVRTRRSFRLRATVAAMGEVLCVSGDKAVLALLATRTETAVYAVAATFGTLASVPAVAATYARLRSIGSAPDRYAAAWNHVIIATAASLPVVIATLLLGPLAIEVTLGDRYSASAPPMRVLAVATIPLAATYAATTVLAFLGHAGLTARAWWVGVGLMVATLPPLALRAGALGAALSCSVVYLGVACTAIASLFHTRRRASRALAPLAASNGAPT